MKENVYAEYAEREQTAFEFGRVFRKPLYSIRIERLYRNPVFFTFYKFKDFFFEFIVAETRKFEFEEDSDLSVDEFEHFAEKGNMFSGRKEIIVAFYVVVRKIFYFYVFTANAFERTVVKNDYFAAFEQMNVGFDIITVFNSVTEGSHRVFR